MAAAGQAAVSATRQAAHSAASSAANCDVAIATADTTADAAPGNATGATMPKALIALERMGLRPLLDVGPAAHDRRGCDRTRISGGGTVATARGAARASGFSRGSLRSGAPAARRSPALHQPLEGSTIDVGGEQFDEAERKPAQERVATDCEADVVHAEQPARRHRDQAAVLCRVVGEPGHDADPQADLHVGLDH